MHRIIQDGLEDYLAGRVRRDVELHLKDCQPCQREIEEIGFVSSIFRNAFDAPAEPVPAPSQFYARLSDSIEARKSSSLWAFFSIDAVFGRRVAFASLLALATVGGFLISRESDATLDIQGPEAVIAQHDMTEHDATVNRDRMMVTLASYER